MYEKGDFKGALRGAKDWKLGVSKSERNQIRRSYECLVHPEFYVSLGLDLEKEVQKGVSVLGKNVQGKELK